MRRDLEMFKEVKKQAVSIQTKCIYRIHFNFCGVKLSWITDFSNFSVFIFANAGS